MNLDKIDWTLLPEPLHEGVRHYIEHGQPTGDFLAAVIMGNRGEAAARADDVNARRLDDIFLFFEKCAPPECHGSVDKQVAWIDRNGLQGWEE